MKRLSALLLVFIMVFSFASCGDEKVDPENETTSPQEEKNEGVVTLDVFTEKTELIEALSNTKFADADIIQ